MPDPPPAPGRARSLLRSTSWQALSQVVPLAINLVLTPFVIHGIGPARFSAFLLIATLANLLGQFDGGIGTSTLRFCSLYAGTDDKTATTRLVTTTVSVITVLTILVSAAVTVLTPYILGFFGVIPAFVDEATVLLRTLTVLIGLILIRTVFHSVLAARHWFRWLSITMLIGYAVYAAGLYLAGRNGWDLRFLAAVMVAHQVTTSLLTIPPALAYLDRAGLAWMPRAQAREFFGYAWRAQVTGLVAIAVSQKDQLVAGRVLSAQASGPYSQGYGLAFQLKSLPYNAIKPIQATLGEEYARRGADAVATVQRLQRIWVRAVTGWAVVGVPASYVGIRAWLPDSFSLTGTVVAVLFAGHCLTLLTLVLSLWTLTAGHPELELRANLVSLVVNLALSAALLPMVGMIGVIAATAVGQLAGTLHLIRLARRTLTAAPRSALREIPWLAAMAAAALAAALELSAHGHLPRGVLGLLAAGALALPAAVLYVLLAFGPQLRTWRRARRTAPATPDPRRPSS
ncbi:MAG: polysaccharide biosynthesis C-terminal domain-containing protein [Austwickia sp.]|nr:polysaccharide biosynthesis C-terminal domain-containing protein [Austwickia sp.]MBK8437687.1 polysaccharide biosynthesis C-terminal domain-containing protein [Austwickia sp.]MBK9099998.1 polysaccharide biosynthesis C-terminal domain-containing protein [Austwickia sp.]